MMTSALNSAPSPPHSETNPSSGRIRVGSSTSTDAERAANELYEQIAQPDIGLAVFFCSSDYDLQVLGDVLARRFAGIQLIGCTTAGEISPAGYRHGSIAGVSFAGPEFRTEIERIDRLKDFGLLEGEALGQRLKKSLMERGDGNSAAEKCFGFLLIDGISMREEPVISAIYRGISDTPIFGGSAADELAFEQTHVYHDGQFHEDSAVFALVATTRPFTVFKTQHFVATEKRLVVTKARVSERTVTEINGMSAAREYARVVGIDVEDLSQMVFATHPVIVRIGGSIYVRSITTMNDDESLTFACAIDEGIVLTVAESVDLIENLENVFREVRAEIGAPELILGCDCAFRTIEIEQDGLVEDVARIMRANNVIGFCTYGEQFNAMHVNQTFTGVAIASDGTSDGTSA